MQTWVSYYLPQIDASSEIPSHNFLHDRISPESPRWLIVKRNTSKAKDLCMSIAHVNDKNIPTEEIKLEEIHEETMGDIRDLFLSRKMAVKTLITKKKYSTRK